MKTNTLRLPFALVAVLTFAVLPAECKDVPVSKMAPQLQYRGFSIQRPTDDRWFFDDRDQKPNYALFRIPTISETYSVVATVGLQQLESAPASESEFKEMVDRMMSQHSSRFEAVSYESKLTSRQGQWCVEYTSKVIDRTPANSSIPLILRGQGFVVLHPKWKETVVSALFSERVQEKELTEEIQRMGPTFLSWIVLESKPGKKIGG
jgi:hypothetical protein